MAKNNFSSKEEVFFEEAVFDSFSSHKNLNHLELPVSKKAFALIAAAAILIAGVVFLRVLYLSSFMGGFYSLRSEANVGKEIYNPSNRGIIYDRYGEPLVENIPAFAVSLKIKDFSENSEAEKQALSDILEIPLLEIGNKISGQNIERSPSFILARDVDSEKIISLKALNLKGVEIIDDYKRQYIDGPAFSHVLGYTGMSDKSNEIIGKTGIELSYDDILKGTDGKTIVYRDAKGNIFDKKIVEEPKNGESITLTIDADLQNYFYNSLNQALINLGRNSAVGLAINPQNGEVLSLISLPSFDNNIFSRSRNNAEKNRILNSVYAPLFNKAISGAYTPASTIKPMVGLAALAEGLIDPKKQILSIGYIEIPNPYDSTKPSRFLDWKANGWVDLYSALARSSNVYFYEVGGGFEDQKGLGIDKLKEYWQKFGLGKKTGIDLPSEAEGFLPDPVQKEADKNDIWRIGDTYNVSIGQGDLLVTPIQLISQIAAIGNGGYFYKPHVLKDAASETLIDFSNLGNYIKEIKRGMGDAVSKHYGTANMLSSIPVGIGAKTGSSQVSNNLKTNAFFVGFMPLENPQIAILVLIENAKEGSLNAVPVAKDVLEWYYWNRIVNL
ncbi:MAG: penicillin-binding transpeptidase domain-containing protein [bacterium]|nr:penicillin-binding transpeptidase domain-containing protein [bacterium]